MAIKRHIASLLFVFSAFACEEEATIPLATQNTALLVVEGVVTNENRQHAIRLTSPYQTQNGQAPAVTDAVVSISDGTSVIQLAATDSGYYVSPKMRFISGVTYTLTINRGGRQFTAKDQAVAVESLPALSYANAEGGYRFNFFETGSQPNYIEYTVDWSKTPSCSTTCDAKLLYYDLKTIDAHNIFKPDKTDFIFPAQSTIIRRKFSVSDNYRAFLRSMLSETQWRGSVFDIQRDNAPTNLSEGAIGFFAVSTVVSDTVKIP